MELQWTAFVSRVKTNLHFTLCFNPVGATLRNRLRRFPTLVNCTSIDWMMPWPENDLLKVALHRIQTDDLIPKDKAPEIAKILVMMFEDSEKEENHGIVTRSQPITMHITPTIFLDLTSTFLHLAHKIQDETLKLCTRYEQGLRMMYKTETSVSTMQATLKINQPVLEEKAAEMKVIIVEIDGATAEADKERAEVRVEEEQANKIMEGAKEVKEDCEANLAVAMPAMDAATKAVSEIDKKQIVELKSMANPPERIKKIIEAVCIVLDVKPDEKESPITGKKTYDYWTPTKTKVMADAEEFRSMLMNYDKENMNPEIFEKKIQPYIKDKNFKPQAVKDVSQALVGVTQWVIAMETYYRVVEVVRPKQLKLKEAEQEFNDAMAILNDKKEKLRQIDERLAGLRMRLDDCTKQREVLEEEQRETELKLHRAVRLMDGLEDEKVRYTNQVKELTERLTLSLEIPFSVQDLWHVWGHLLTWFA